MANNALSYDTPAINALANWCANLNSGFLEIWTGAQPALDGALTGTKLAKLPLSATFAPTPVASGGVVTATANAITSASALATGTAGYFALLESDDATVVLTGTVGTSGCDLNLNSTAIVSGANVSVTALAITQAQ